MKIIVDIPDNMDTELCADCTEKLKKWLKGEE